MIKQRPWLLVLVCLSIFASTSAQPNYRIKLVKDRGIFILPPHAKIAHEGLFCSRKELTWREHSRFSYQYIIFSGLRKNSNYAYLSEKAKKAEYFFSSTDATIFLENKYNIYDKGVLTPHRGARILFSNDSSVIALIIDNTVLMKGDPVANFNILSIDLLLRFAGLEHVYGAGVSGFSQVLLEKIFELIPHPQQNALSQFIWSSSTGKSFVLLNPRIALFVDHQTFFILRPNLPGNWNYNLGQQDYISFYRSADGQLKQSPFIDFEHGEDQMPDNKKDRDGKTILLTSSADIQLGNNTRSLAYVALYQDYMKRNTATSSTGSNDLTHKAKDKDLYIGNSMLLFNNNMNTLITDPTSPDNTRAGFGNDTLLLDPNQFARRLITPAIPIWLNGQLLPVKLGSTVDMQDQQTPLGSNFKIQRWHNGKYRKLKYYTPDTYFLPGDKVNN